LLDINLAINSKSVYGNMAKLSGLSSMGDDHHSGGAGAKVFLVAISFTDQEDLAGGLSRFFDNWGSGALDFRHSTSGSQRFHLLHARG